MSSSSTRRRGLREDLGDGAAIEAGAGDEAVVGIAFVCGIFWWRAERDGGRVGAVAARSWAERNRCTSFVVVEGRAVRGVDLWASKTPPDVLSQRPLLGMPRMSDSGFQTGCSFILSVPLELQ